jgi:hypothetical protein
MLVELCKVTHGLDKEILANSTTKYRVNLEKMYSLHYLATWYIYFSFAVV